MSVEIIPTRINQTAAQWGSDATIYEAWKILVTTDVFYGSTDQPKFKLADGVQTWAQLSYVPIDIALALTFAQVLANGNKTGEQSMESDNTYSFLSVLNAFSWIGFNNGTNAGVHYSGADFSSVEHTLLLQLIAPNVRLPSETASRVLILDASKNIKSSAVTTTTLGFLDATSSIQTQLNGKQASGTYATGTGTANGTNTGDETLARVATILTSAASDTTFNDADEVFRIESGVIVKSTWAVQKARVTRYGNPYFCTGNTSVLDSSSLFFGQVNTPAVTFAAASLVPQIAGKIIGFALHGFNAATVGSSEDCTLNLHYNGGANSAVITTQFKVNGNRSTYQVVTGLNIDIGDGNTAIELVTGVLATNPNAFRFYAVPILG